MTTIDEALRKVKRLKGDLAVYKTRIQEAAKFKKGDEPAFTYVDSYQEYKKATRQLIDLRSRIAEANATTLLSDGSTLTEAVTTLSEIKSEIALLTSLSVNVQAERTETNREYDYDEEMKRVGRDVTTVWISAVTKAEQASKIRSLQDQFDALNAQVEKANRETPLTESVAPLTQT